MVIAASLLLCPHPHSHHHLPLPHPPSNICVFQRPAWEGLSSNHTGLPLVQELAFGKDFGPNTPRTQDPIASVALALVTESPAPRLLFRGPHWGLVS